MAKHSNNKPDAAATATASTTRSSSSATTTTSTTLGDIMGLVTDAQGLAVHYGIAHPLDRMALTANGNLQRLVSSYYDAPVSVVVDACWVRSDNDDDEAVLPQIWDRRVRLLVHGRVFCTATSVIAVHDPLCAQWVASGEVGLGQLFRHLSVLPVFALQGAGRQATPGLPSDAARTTGGGGFWRDYTLTCDQVSCQIHEDFAPGLWSFEPTSTVDS
jgi:chorismate-pyruvate lyase